MTLSLHFSKYSFLPTLVCSFLRSWLIVDTDPEAFDPGTLPTEVLESLEADSFWCLSALLDGIQVKCA